MDSTINQEVQKCQKLYQGRVPDRDNAKGGKFSKTRGTGDTGVTFYFTNSLLEAWGIEVEQALQEYCPLFIISRIQKGIMAPEYIMQESTFVDMISPGKGLPSFADTVKKYRDSLTSKYDSMTQDAALDKINTTYRNEWAARLKLSPDILGKAEIRGTLPANGHVAWSYFMEGLPTDNGKTYWLLDNSTNVETSDKDGEKTIEEAYLKTYGKNLPPAIDPEAIEKIF